MKKSVLVALADRNYINQAKQLFSSVYFNSGWKGDYLLLSHNIPEKDLKWFRNKGIIVKKVKPLMYKRIDKWGPSIYSKFYMFTPYFRQWKNVVYLDSDIIVKGSLDNLTKIRGFYAVSYGDTRLYEQFYEINKDLLKEKCNLNYPSFNSGVIVFSTDIIKKDTFIDLKYMFNKYKYIIDGEEPLLNLYFQRAWSGLSLEYNFPIVFFNKLIERIFGEAIVKHFVITKNKPWTKRSIFYREWKKNLKNAYKIDLKNRPNNKNSENNKKIKDFNRIKKIILFLIIIKKFYFKKIYLKLKKFYLLIDRSIGKIGIFFKKIFPESYFYLKRIKDRKN